MAKLACKACGGKVKMATGGAMPKVLAKAKTQLYGIPQENMGTSSQYGFGKKGGTVKKTKVGGTTKATKFAALAPPYNKATAADRIAGAKKKK